MHSSFCFSHRLDHFLTSSSPIYIYLKKFTKEFAPDSFTNGFTIVINKCCYVIKERKQATLAMHRTIFFNLLHLTFPALCSVHIQDDFLVNCTQPSFSPTISYASFLLPYTIFHTCSTYVSLDYTRCYKSVERNCYLEVKKKKVLFDNEKLNSCSILSYKSNIKFLSWQTLTASLLYIKQPLLWNRLGDEGGKFDPSRRSLHLNSHCIPFCPYIYTVKEKPIQRLNGTAL